MPIQQVYKVRCDYCEKGFTSALGDSKREALNALCQKGGWQYVGDWGDSCFAIYCPGCWKAREEQEDEIKRAVSTRCSCSPKVGTVFMNNSGGTYWVECSNCGRNTGSAASSLQAAKFWNQMSRIWARCRS